MILCQMKDLSRYRHILPPLDLAIRFLQENDLSALASGRNEIAGDDTVFVNRFAYETQSEDRLLFETHAAYIDMHLLLSGEETIYVAPVETQNAVEERPEDDYLGSEGAWQSACRLTPGTVLIVFPGEAHKVKCATHAPCGVVKLVVKVKAEA